MAQQYSPARLAAMRETAKRRYGPWCLYFDTETTGIDPDTLRMTTASVLCIKNMEIYTFTEADMPALAALLDATAANGSKILVHNSPFDMWKVMAGYFDKERVAVWFACVVDPFLLVKQQERLWVGMDALGQMSGVTKKTSTGKEATVMWQNGEIDKLRSYCAFDVVVLFEISVLPFAPFCIRRYNADMKKQVHIGYGILDMETQRVHVAYGEGVFYCSEDGKEHCTCKSGKK